MNTIKGNRLYVELSASQARRRLRGHRFGVRKVETAGRNRAAIIHTATGQHRRDLETLFRDVLATRSGNDSPEAPESTDENNSEFRE